MSNIDKQALREVAVKATALNLDTAQLKRRENESCECPVCFGEGYVDVESDYCNIDGVALGVLFYGIGEHHGLAETFFRAANPATVLALLDELDSANGYASAYEAEKWHYHGLAESEGERADRAEKRTAELEEIATDYAVKFMRAQDALKHQALLHKSQMEVAEKQVEELTMWVKRLAHSLRNARPDSKLHGAAMDYLSRNGLISVEDVLR